MKTITMDYDEYQNDLKLRLDNGYRSGRLTVLRLLNNYKQGKIGSDDLFSELSEYDDVERKMILFILNENEDYYEEWLREQELKQNEIPF